MTAGTRLRYVLTWFHMRPWRAWIGYMVLVTGLYLLATRCPQRGPLVVEPGAIDALMPFVPAAAYVYATYALLLPVLIVVAARRRHFGGVFAVAMGCGLSNAVLYNLMPTCIARRTDAPVGSLLETIQRLDTTLGAVPSGHVALPAAVATAALMLAMRGAGAGASTFWARAAAAYTLWTVALTASALLTAQHYVIDVVAGLAFGTSVAGFGMWILGEPMESMQCGG
jgi:hypothetical protein